MTDKTKKLFNAPWRATDLDYVEDSEGYYICEAETHEQSNRIALLPELYEELKSSSYDYCWSCLAMLGIDPPTEDELVENLCPRKPSFCGYNNRWKLLKKVRNGK